MSEQQPIRKLPQNPERSSSIPSLVGHGLRRAARGVINYFDLNRRAAQGYGSEHPAQRPTQPPQTPRRRV